MLPILTSTPKKDFRCAETTLRRLAALVVAQGHKNAIQSQPAEVAGFANDKPNRKGVVVSGKQNVFESNTMAERPKVTGDKTLAALYDKLAHIDRLQYPRSHHQVKFHDCFTRSCLRIIYGDDYDRIEPYLLKEFDVKEFRNEVMIVTPRRFGKTFSVAQFCAAFATSVLGKEVAIFSTGRRASKKILDLVIRFIRPIMRSTQKIVLRNVEEVHLFDTATQSLNKVCSYPSKVQVRVPSPVCLHSLSQTRHHLLCKYETSRRTRRIRVPKVGLRLSKWAFSDSMLSRMPSTQSSPS